ncbi:MAG: acetolactate synthase small subunit [Chloroflexota bacterium]|nr:acetolactate synthase small subunit [Chloroflexota bacterium]MDE2856836.1 acetolactate synthase small subunit [Chloroflexota bacterium]MDE2950375.1 acetolactate synthase small subunit [Chloroflexota bacterium]
MTSQVDINKVTVVALVENEPGVLNRIASLFRRRAFNIDSLTVGRTHKPHISRMTIRVVAGPEYARKIATNLQKLVNVIDVRVLDNEPHVERDLALIKVRNDDADSRNTITEICDRYPARIVDVGPKVAIIEMVATEEILEEFIDEVRPTGIVEMIRTGVVSMGRGTRIHDTNFTRRDLAKIQNQISAGGNGNVI